MPNTPTEQPHFTHDDDCCTFLGHHNATTPNGANADLYHCHQSGNPTLIARYSNEPADYQSGLAFADHIPELGEARTRAQTLGLLPTTGPTND